MYEVNTYYTDNYKIIGKRESVYKGKKVLILDIESEVSNCKCHECSKISEINNVSTYYRDIEDVPYNFESIWLHVHAHKYLCTNEVCDKKYFDEVLPFARKNKVKTDNFIQFILTLSIFLSSTATSLILSLLGTSASADVVDKIIGNIVVKDNANIEEIGVDDVAIRKGQKYATAINNVIPNCFQVADRFHLFQNLIENLKDIFYSKIPEKIFIKDGKITDKPVAKVRKELTNIDSKILETLNYDNSIPIDKNGNEIVYDNKVRNFDSKQYMEQKQRRIEKKQMIIKLRELSKNNPSYNLKELAIEFKISVPSICKYLKMSTEEVNDIDKIRTYKKGKTKMDDYSNIIYKMLNDNISQEYIFVYIRLKGCEASDRYLANYINLVAKNNGYNYEDKTTFLEFEYPSDVEVITRQELLKYLLTIDKKKVKNQKIEKNIELIYEKYPISKKIQSLFKDFHDVMFSASPNNLDEFIKKYQDDVVSFCNGLKKDIAPIKNAISYEINFGFVEGNNNKFKLIKRIVYGKSKLCNLLKRSYISFMSTLDDFDISTIVEDILAGIFQPT